MSIKSHYLTLFAYHWHTIQRLLAGAEELSAAEYKAEIEADIFLTTLGGNTFPFARWRGLQHLILHGMQHHSELARLLTLNGRSLGDLDFAFFTG
ncbi:MAG: hypothetical protein GY796_04835 [Chloroflexi bacterium]|nr:hypothetical protein [Chloroflexota bacterium]